MVNAIIKSYSSYSTHNFNLSGLSGLFGATGNNRGANSILLLEANQDVSQKIMGTPKMDGL